MKECSMCHIEKDESEFYIDQRKKAGSDRHRSICKACWRERKKAYCEANKEKISDNNRKYYAKNKVRENARSKRWKVENEYRAKELARNRLSRGHDFLNSMKTPCAKCGETRLHIIQFHHIDPSKKSFNLGVSRATRLDNDYLIPEIKKCVCLCANCHFEFHYFFGNKPRNPVEALEEYLGGSEND